MSSTDSALVAYLGDPTLAGVSLAVTHGSMRTVGRRLLAARRAHKGPGLLLALAHAEDEPRFSPVAAGDARPEDFAQLWLVDGDEARVLLCVAHTLTGVWREVVWIGLGEPTDWARIENRATWGPYGGVRTSPTAPEVTRPVCEVRIVDGERVFWVEIYETGASCDCGRDPCRHIHRARYELDDGGGPASVGGA